MKIPRKYYPLLAFNLLAVFAYGAYFLSIGNYEFIIYIFVILFFLGLVVATLEKFKYSNTVLWGLSLWGFLHMSGGGLYIGETKLYGLMLLPISETYSIFRFDQFVHAFGFAVATLVMYEVLRPLMKEKIKGVVALWVILVAAGTGLGALNEVIEFSATVVLEETGVGGYINNSIDLVFNLLGSALAALWLVLRIKKRKELVSLP